MKITSTQFLLSNSYFLIHVFGSDTYHGPSTLSNSYKRLKSLKGLLNQTAEISQKELANEILTTDDYNFINNFDKQIRSIIGDIKKENIQNSYTFDYNITETNQLNEKISGFDYLVAVYPDKAGRLFFAVGPVFNYNEQGKIANSVKKNANWQNEFKE